MTQSDANLVCHFESLGRNCEFGYVQRLTGAEPMGLLRFAGMPFDALIRALRTRFAGITEPGNLEVSLDGAEYRITAKNLSLGYHTELHESEISRAALLKIELRKVRFLVSQLLDDLDGQRKIFVYQHPHATPEHDLAVLAQALAEYGPVSLLWVVVADATHLPGTVTRINDVLMIGYVERFAPTWSVHLPHLPSWLALCRAAHLLWSASHGFPASLRPPGRGSDSRQDVINIGFGAGGTGQRHQLGGWWEPEADFTWTSGSGSALALRMNRDQELMIGLQVFPYVRPPQLPAQRLTVIVNGTKVAVFTVQKPSYLRIPVAARVLRNAASIQVVFRHPDAAAPSAHSSDDLDSRELAFAFQRVSLHWSRSSC